MIVLRPQGLDMKWCAISVEAEPRLDWLVYKFLARWSSIFFLLVHIVKAKIIA